MPRRRPNPLADAHEANRGLRNDLHKIRESHLPLHERIRELERDLAAMTRRAEIAERQNMVSRNAFRALVAMLHEMFSNEKA